MPCKKRRKPKKRYDLRVRFHREGKDILYNIDVHYTPVWHVSTGANPLWRVSPRLVSDKELHDDVAPRIRRIALEALTTVNSCDEGVLIDVIVLVVVERLNENHAVVSSIVHALASPNYTDYSPPLVITKKCVGSLMAGESKIGQTPVTVNHRIIETIKQLTKEQQHE